MADDTVIRAANGGVGAITLCADGGRGRTVCVLRERGAAHAGSELLHAQLSLKARALLVDLPQINGDSWESVTDGLIESLSAWGVRQASFVALGPACTVLLAAYLREPRVFRTAVVVDATCRAHPSALTRMVDWIEGHLPLGLPLRLRTKEFDAKPFLHRIRCPTLLVTTSRSSAYQRAQAQEMSERMPTSWWIPLASESGSEEQQLTSAILDFYDIPARCPQKNLPGDAAAISSASNL